MDWNGKLCSRLLLAHIDYAVSNVLTPHADHGAWIGTSRRLIEIGRTEVVALTLGANGALLVSRDGAFRAGAPDIQAVSTVGAGDSFVGGMVGSLAAGAGLIDAFRYGVVTGSAAVLNQGTELCHAPDVTRLYERIEMVHI